MATDLSVDDQLIEEAQRIGQHKTKTDAVSAALKEYIQRHQQMSVTDLFGTIDYDPAYDYKADRGRRPS